jgi:hypothetical protein
MFVAPIPVDTSKALHPMRSNFLIAAAAIRHCGNLSHILTSAPAGTALTKINLTGEVGSFLYESTCWS